MADASVLGIHPPATVRISLDGWVQDWPFECVRVFDDRVAVRTAFGPAALLTVLSYAYEHAHQRDDGSWLFVGAEDFTVTAGPPQAPSVN